MSVPHRNCSDAFASIWRARGIASSIRIANATYGYDNRYVLNGTVRYEGSNAMGKSRSARWTPTWLV